MKCRFCATELQDVFIDLTNCPPSNSFLAKEDLALPEQFYPLKVFTCRNCFLVQIDEYKKSSSIFNDQYVYFSSYSRSWLEHARRYTDMAIGRFGLTSRSKVVEIASNDGYLLQYFHQKNIPVMGIEPTKNTAEVAAQKGIPSITEFFTEALAHQLAASEDRPDLLIGNNVLAHVPDIVDFVKGLKVLLKETGVITLEFPHLLQLVENNQFDTIYHEHYSYLSFTTVRQIFGSVGLTIFDVEELPTHGGSIRIFARHANCELWPLTPHVQSLLDKEEQKGMKELGYYNGFHQKALQVKLDVLEFLVQQKNKGKKIAAYGAAAKGNTLLNYCGIKSDLIDFVADANPNKQNKWLPGSHIKVVHEDYLRQQQPDFVILFAWNLKEEIMEQLSYISDWGGSFVIPIPFLEIISINQDKTDNKRAVNLNYKTKETVKL